MKRIKSVLRTDRPSVSRFVQVCNQLSDEDRESLIRDIKMLSACYWNELPAEFRNFVNALIRHDRQAFADYLVHETPLGDHQMDMGDPQQFLNFVSVYVEVHLVKPVPYRQIAMVLVIEFRIPYKVRTVAEYLQRRVYLAGDLLPLLGRLEIIGDWD